MSGAETSLASAAHAASDGGVIGNSGMGDRFRRNTHDCGRRLRVPQNRVRAWKTLWCAQSPSMAG